MATTLLKLATGCRKRGRVGREIITMKKYYILFTFLSIFIMQLVFGKETPCSNCNNCYDCKPPTGNTDTSNKCCIEIKTKISEINNTLAITSINIDSLKKALHRPLATFDTDLGPGQWFLVFSPFLLFLIVLGFLFFFTGLKNFKIVDALAENEITKQTIINPEYSATVKSISMISTGSTTPSNLSTIVPPTLEVTLIPGDDGKNDFRPSSSRFIALFSGLLTVVLAVCMTSFFLYQYMATSSAPDLSNLSTVLISLGIGVTPYAANKISTAIAAPKIA